MQPIPRFRRESVRADFFLGKTRHHLRVWIALPLLLGPFFIQAAVASPEESRLEIIEFLRGGEQRQAIGTVSVEGEKVRLRLFSDQLANYYELTIPMKDFLEAQPIGAEKTAQIEETRRTAIASRELQREERRRRRTAERALARLEREESGRDSQRRSGESRGGRAEGVDRGEKRPQTKRDLRSLSRDLDERFKAAEALAAETLARIAERLETDVGPKRKLRELAVEVEEAQLDLERLEKSLSHRREALERLEDDSRRGNLKGRQLQEQIEYVADHYHRVSIRLLSAEEAVTFTSRLLAAIPFDLPKVEEPSVESEVAQNLKGVVTPRLSARRAKQVEVASGQVEEAVYTRGLTTASSNSSALIAGESNEEATGTPSATSESEAPVSKDKSAPIPQFVDGDAHASGSTEGLPGERLSGGFPKWPLVVIAVLGFALGRGARRRA